MTEGTKLKSQELLEERHGVQNELDALTREQRALSADMEQARAEDVEERMEAVSRGGNIRQTVASLVSRARGVQSRAEELPDIIWTTRMRLFQLDVEYHAQKYAELELELPGAQVEFREVDALLPEVQKRRERALDRVGYLTWEMRDLEKRREEAQGELEALKRSGPES